VERETVYFAVATIQENKNRNDLPAIEKLLLDGQNNTLSSCDETKSNSRNANRREYIMSEENNELKPCPFCGGEVHRIDGEDENAHDIECDGCAYIFYDTSEGNNWWNDRPMEDALEEAAIKQAEEIYNLIQVISDLKEDGERLANKLVVEWSGKDGFTFECQMCENGFYETRESVIHLPDCPITLHAALMEKLKEAGI
jgi:Zn finger protein HypA/HybF involved in hydrogenase expression